ncbi:MAG: type I methionyl aminopeptidase, partial [Spirochaetales bacterium]|nr:type I methionyl aminopeptidase [Candidatus Physcosoma equi]
MFETVGPKIAAGASTWDVDQMCEDFMKKHHAKGPCKGYFGYPNATCTSVNDTVIHGTPNKKHILKDGDIISLDVCIDLDGYISDSTHTYEIGTVIPEVHQLNVVTEKSLYLGIEAASQPNASIQNIGGAVSTYVRKFKYGVVSEYCGHGVGLELHEEPEVPNYVSLANPNPRIRKGMVFAIEPMINMGSAKIYTLDDEWTVKTADGKPAC